MSYTTGGFAHANPDAFEAVLSSASHDVRSGMTGINCGTDAVIANDKKRLKLLFEPFCIVMDILHELIACSRYDYFSFANAHDRSLPLANMRMSWNHMTDMDHSLQCMQEILPKSTTVARAALITAMVSTVLPLFNGHRFAPAEQFNVCLQAPIQHLLIGLADHDVQWTHYNRFVETLVRALQYHAHMDLDALLLKLASIMTDIRELVTKPQVVCAEYQVSNDIGVLLFMRAHRQPRSVEAFGERNIRISRVFDVHCVDLARSQALAEPLEYPEPMLLGLFVLQPNCSRLNYWLYAYAHEFFSREKQRQGHISTPSAFVMMYIKRWTQACIEVSDSRGPLEVLVICSAMRALYRAFMTSHQSFGDSHAHFRRAQMSSAMYEPVSSVQSAFENTRLFVSFDLKENSRREFTLLVTEDDCVAPQIKARSAEPVAAGRHFEFLEKKLQPSQFDMDQLFCLGCSDTIYYKDGAMAHTKGCVVDGREFKPADECSRLVCSMCWSKMLALHAEKRKSEPYDNHILKCFNCNMPVQYGSLVPDGKVQSVVAPVHAFMIQILKELRVQCKLPDCEHQCEAQHYDAHLESSHPEQFAHDNPQIEVSERMMGRPNFNEKRAHSPISYYTATQMCISSSQQTLWTPKSNVYSHQYHTASVQQANNCTTDKRVCAKMIQDHEPMLVLFLCMNRHQMRLVFNLRTHHTVMKARSRFYRRWKDIVLSRLRVMLGIGAQIDSSDHHQVMKWHMDACRFDTGSLGLDYHDRPGDALVGYCSRSPTQAAHMAQVLGFESSSVMLRDLNSLLEVSEDRIFETATRSLPAPHSALLRVALRNHMHYESHSDFNSDSDNESSSSSSESSESSSIGSSDVNVHAQSRIAFLQRNGMSMSR
jgi:hypothetical protein